MKKPRIDSSYIEKEDLDKILDHYFEIINQDKNKEHKDKFKRIIKDSAASLRKNENQHDLLQKDLKIN